MKIVICPDSFKGSLKAKEVSQIIAESIKEIMPSAHIVQIPLADGGEGTADLLHENDYPERVNLYAHDPIGNFIQTQFYSDPSHKRAFIESADIIGLPLIAPKDRNPLNASSRGLGEVIKYAAENGFTEITVSLGGSATCDGGKGMLEALKGIRLEGIEFKIICDVDNPLLGENGAVYIYSPQKGAKKEDLPILESKMVEFVFQCINKGLCSVSDTTRAGAGAAGGLGFAFQSILHAQTFKGIDFIFHKTNFEEEIENADLIITGEGKIDKQSLMGKVLSGVISKAKLKDISIIAIGGIVEDKDIIIKAGVKEIYEIINKELSHEENMKRETAMINLKKCILNMLKSNIMKQIK